MKKSVTAGFAALVSAAAFAGMNNVLVSFSTPGPDTYADGTRVLDGECYALVWTPDGAEFTGINADGTAAGSSKVAIAAPLAKDGRCPNVTFQIDEDYRNANFPDGTWGVYLLDTRRFKTDDDGVIVTDADGGRVVDSVGGKTVNGYGEVSTLASAAMASGASGSSAAVTTTSASPAGAGNLKVNDIRLIGDNVYIYVTGTLSCLQYGLQSGSKPDGLSDADGNVKYGVDDGEMVIVTPKKGGVQFFQVNRK